MTLQHQSARDLAKALATPDPAPAPEAPRIVAARKMLTGSKGAERDRTFLGLLEASRSEAEIEAVIRIGAELGLVPLPSDSEPTEPAGPTIGGEPAGEAPESAQAERAEIEAAGYEAAWDTGAGRYTLADSAREPAADAFDNARAAGYSVGDSLEAAETAAR